MDHQVVHHGVGLGVIEVLVALLLVVMLAAGPRSRDPVAPLLLGVSMALLVTTARVAVVARPHPRTAVDVGVDAQPLLVVTALVLYGGRRPGAEARHPFRPGPPATWPRPPWRWRWPTCSPIR